MDVCARTVIIAANQYLTSSSNSNLVYLQSQLENLQSQSLNPLFLKFFNSRDMLAIDCLTCLVQFISDPQIKPSLTHHCFLVFNNLVKDQEVCTVLQKNFHLSEILAGVLRGLLDRQADSLILECLELLLKLTYGQTINFHDNQTHFLLSFLIKNICENQNELTQPCLGLLANICRNNITVQKYIRDTNNKKLYRTLFTFLTDKNKTIIIFSLSVIFNVFQHEDLGEKVLSGRNLINTLQLLFNILVNGDSGLTRRYTVDVFRDISKKPRILRTLVNYDQLPACLESCLEHLKSCKPDSVSKIFELLIDFCSASQIRATICRLMFKCQPLTDSNQLDQMLRKTVNQSISPLFATIHWASQPVDNTESHKASLLALDLLQEVFEEMLYSDVNLDGCVNHSETMVTLLLHLLRTNQQLSSDSSDITKQLQKTTKILQFLIVLCNDDKMKKMISSKIDVQLFTSILDYQLNHNKDIYMYQLAGKTKYHDWSDIGMEIVLLCLNLMSKLRRCVTNLDDCFKSHLQDCKLVPLLASYLTSDNKQNIQTALQLVATAANLDIYLDVVLCDTVASINSNKRKVPDITTPDFTTSLQDINYDKENIQPSIKKSSPQDDKSLQNLITRMETNLEMKDNKMSDVIQLYEHQLQTLKVNKEHLENLLKAKSLELVQSDRLISQYRISGARFEADSQNLRSMFHQSESKCENLLEQINEMRLQRDSLQDQVESLEQQNYKYSTLSEEYEELKSNHSELIDREDKSSRSLTAVRQEMKAKIELYDMLQKYHTDLKQQNDIACDQLHTLEKENKSQEKLLKEKEAKLQETSKCFVKLESKYVTMCKEKEDLERDREELEKGTDQLRSELSKLADTKKELQQKVTSLEKVCQEHEKSIAEKDQVLEEQEEQISKHAQIAALIQSFGAPTTRGKKK